MEVQNSTSPKSTGTWGCEYHYKITSYNKNSVVLTINLDIIKWNNCKHHISQKHLFIQSSCVNRYRHICKGKGGGGAMLWPAEGHNDYIILIILYYIIIIQ